MAGKEWDRNSDEFKLIEKVFEEKFPSGDFSEQYLEDIFQGFLAAWEYTKGEEESSIVLKEDNYDYLKVDTDFNFPRALISDAIKIIFLDIDGVLNNCVDSEYHLGDKGNHHLYSKKRVHMLNLILKHTGAKIVVSSTWRLGRSIEELQATLSEIGIKGEVIGKTESFSDSCIMRGNEIFKWIIDNEAIVGTHWHFKNYVILDDDSDMLHWQRDNFVHTDGRIGLVVKDVLKAIHILNMKHLDKLELEKTYETIT